MEFADEFDDRVSLNGPFELIISSIVRGFHDHSFETLDIVIIVIDIV
jgi:hypothetical protein